MSFNQTKRWDISTMTETLRADGKMIKAVFQNNQGACILWFDRKGYSVSTANGFRNMSVTGALSYEDARERMKLDIAELLHGG